MERTKMNWSLLYVNVEQHHCKTRINRNTSKHSKLWFNIYVIFLQWNVQTPFAGGVVEVLEGEVLVVEVLEGGVARECKIGATFFLSLHSPKLYFKWKYLAVY